MLFNRLKCSWYIFKEQKVKNIYTAHFHFICVNYTKDEGNITKYGDPFRY